LFPSFADAARFLPSSKAFSHCARHGLLADRELLPFFLEQFNIVLSSDEFEFKAKFEIKKTDRNIKFEFHKAD